MIRRTFLSLFGSAALAPLMPKVPLPPARRAISTLVVPPGSFLDQGIELPLYFRSIPICVVDQLTETESRVL